eukprot:Nitzschia sp. Nitz4//scaffold98_size77359//32605//35181//NITZ4_005548-RA/size77359-processed-gene-0.16-mRNA-1//1//CDS//3329560757//939//frame0
MVEFGLKLEDNKVAEWNEYYMDYDKLKAILKKAKAALKKYDDQAKRRPEEAARIEEEYRNSSHQSLKELAENEEITGLPPRPPVGQADESKYPASETSALLPKTDSGSSLTSASQRAFTSKTLSGIQDYFEGRYERTLVQYLKEADQKADEFANLVDQQRSKVTSFYYQKVAELQKRFGLLIDSVANSSQFKRTVVFKSVDEDPDRRESALMTPRLGQHPRHRRNTSDLTPRQRLETIISNLQHRMVDTQMPRIHSTSSLGTGSNGSDSHGRPPPPPKNNKLQAAAAAGDSDDEDDFNDERALAEADSIRRALTDQYRTAKLLHNFAIMNYTGFVKIIKKHDKTLPERKGTLKNLLTSDQLFDEYKAIDKLCRQYETYFANWFCEGNIREAHAQLLPKRGDGLEMDWSQLRLGYRMGMCAVLALWVCWDSVWGLVSNGVTTIGGRTAFPVFRACGGILLLRWFWGCSVFVWTRYRVNYIYLFDFNPRVVLTPFGIFEEAVDHTLVFLTLMLLYYKSGSHSIPLWIPEAYYPFALVVYTVMQLIFPLRSRGPMWESIRDVVTAPLKSPSFFHGYVGDIFTSMVKVFQDIAWTACWVLSGDFARDDPAMDWASAYWYNRVLIPFLCLFPLLIRFNQCLRRYADTGDRMPHLANAGKYALSQTVTLFGAFHPLYLEITKTASTDFNWFQLFWMLVFVSSSLYSFAWDVCMDWGLGKLDYQFLGPSLMYPQRSYYYAVIAVDLVLRFMWVLTLVPPSSGAKFEVPSYLSAVTMMLELFRRTAWGFFRLENEHRSNASGFRRVDLVPLHFNTGHQHGYKEQQEKRGASVLREVVLIAIGVLGVCVWSVESAQRANRAQELTEF